MADVPLFVKKKLLKKVISNSNIPEDKSAIEKLHISRMCNEHDPDTLQNKLSCYVILDFGRLRQEDKPTVRAFIP